MIDWDIILLKKNYSHRSLQGKDVLLLQHVAQAHQHLANPRLEVQLKNDRNCCRLCLCLCATATNYKVEKTKKEQ